MSAEHVLSLDLGTTSVRALVLRGDGVVVGRAQRALGMHHPAPGRVEQDPEEMLRSSVDVLRAALANAQRDAHDVAALGIVTQRATVIAWDARDGTPLGPALGWQDVRAAGLAAQLQARGLPLPAQAAATRIAWWLAHDARLRELGAAGRLRIGTPETWLASRLSDGAVFATDPGQASCTALWSPAANGWVTPLLDALGIDAGWLPSIVATSGFAGEITASVLGRALPLAALAGDQQAAAFAQGVHRAGEAKLTLGTAAMLDVHTGTTTPPPVRGAYGLALWRLGTAPTQLCVEGNVTTAGAAIDWLVQVGVLPDASALDAVAARAASSEGVVFVPALQGLGTPWLAPQARGFVGGLTRGSGAPQLARAAIDGVAQRCIDVCDAVGFAGDVLRVDGGLGRSVLLLQALADLGGRPVLRAAEIETTALGGALLAGLAVGVFPDLAACRASLAAGTTFEPEQGEAERARHRSRWRAIVERVANDAEDRAANARS